ncbi:MAG: T9SS type A sorting domain-containing protein [Flavobacteriales bacterium]|nr:T9SS type A sorting domain-containing protein [Flavobacteriales bacterium]
MRLIIAALFCHIAFGVAGQITFERTYGGIGGDIGFSVEQTTDNGYALFGVTWNGTAGSTDMYLVKTDEYGTEQWSNTYGSVNQDMGYTARQTNDGGFILCGMVGSFGSDSLTLVRTDANGDPLWARQYPGSLGRDIGYSVQETSDGGFAVCGFTENVGTAEDVYLVRTDANGDTLWTRTVDLGNSEVGWSLRQTDDDGFIVLANRFTFADPEGDIYLIRFDASGDTLWTRTIIAPGVDESHGLAITANGGFILVGGNGYPSRDILLVRTDEFGMEQWRRTYATTGDEMAIDVQEMEDGGFICAGRKENLLTSEIQMHLLRTDPDGDILWERTFQQGIFSEANSLDRTSDGGFVMLGYTVDTLDGAAYTDMYLVKTDGSGYASVSTPTGETNPVFVFPNPTAELVQLDAGTVHLTSVTLFDATGRPVLNRTFTGVSMAELTVGHLSDGAYMLVVSSGERTISTHALQIVH